MAKFRTYFQVGSISDTNVYLGLSPDSEAGTVINTLDQNIVYSIKLSNQKTINSWTSDQRLSHKVVYDFKSKKYVAVLGKRNLRCWQDDTTIDKGKKIKLPKPLEEIISFDNKHTILVYEDGTCESLENRSEHKEAPNWSPIVVSQTHQIINVACFNTRDHHVMLTYFSRNRKSGAMEFVYFLLNDEDMTPSTTVEKIRTIPIARNDLTLRAFTVVEGDEFPSVMTIWSDERILMLPLRCDEDTQTDFQMVDMFKHLRVDKPLVAVNVSPNHVAIYGGNTKQDGASLVLYNTKIHIVKCTQPFKVHLDNCRLCVIGTYIFMAVGQRLSCAQLPTSREKLSDNIGSKRSIDWNGQVNKECINEESELEENVSLNKEALRTSVDDVLENCKPFRHKRQTSPNRAVLPSEIFEDFDSNLRSMYKFDVPVEIFQNESLADSMKIERAVHPADRPYSVAEIAVLVDILENSGRSETEISEIVIPLLIQAKLSNELTICLRKYTNTSERMLAASLKYFIDRKDSADKTESVAELEGYINQVFACSFSKELIKEPLRTNLNLNNAIYLLELIHRNLVADEPQLEESPQYGHYFDSDMQLVNWFIVILDAHYQQFLLARDTTINEKILKWKLLIESFVSGIRDLKSINAKLTSLVNGKLKRNDNASSKWYSVEKVQLY